MEAGGRGGMARIGIGGMMVLAAVLAGCGRDGIPRAQPPQKEAKAAAREAPPPPRAITGYFFAPATPAAGDVPATEYSHSCQSDVGGLNRDPVPLGRPMRSAGRPPVIYHDTLSLISLPLRCVIQDQDGWTEIRILARLRLPREFPGIDFEHRTVLLAGLGPQPTAGYDVRFDSMSVRNDTLFAFVGRTRPRAGSVLTAGTTSPVDVVHVPKHAGPVVFVEE